jgi:DNA primase
MSDGAASPPLLRLYRHRPGSRSDWSEIKGRIDLTKVAAAFLGPPVERRGLTSGSLGWCCPFHVGTIASFRVNLGESIWFCSDCEAGGDAAALVMRMKSIGFRDAIAWLDEQDGLDSSNVVVSDDHASPRAGTVRAFRLDPYAIGE